MFLRARLWQPGLRRLRLSRRALPCLSFFLVSALALAALGAGMIAAFATNAMAQNNAPKSGKAQGGSAPRASEKSGTAALVARGKYLVEGVAMCGQCHTPTDADGNPDRSRWLEGGSLPYMPAKPNSNWPISAPRIGGTPPASDADMIKLLTTGVWTTGQRLRYPMPQFRMSRSDAEAVVAYLRSLTANH